MHRFGCAVRAAWWVGTEVVYDLIVMSHPSDELASGLTTVMAVNVMGCTLSMCCCFLSGSSTYDTTLHWTSWLQITYAMFGRATCLLSEASQLVFLSAHALYNASVLTAVRTRGHGMHLSA